MEEGINSLVIDKKDNVAVAISELKTGNIAVYKIDNKLEKVTVVDNIPIYHKFAVCNINKGDEIYKYGQIIGRATKNINKGEHVHLHNLISIRENI